ncbi:hypothetical protein [Shewanella algae]|uniref:hypothetical protein n=2 Tax=Shewanella TaxID=22 RepID=UPI001AACF253|nr:hypothetical protein [Shewanella algae]QTE94412.1 hypothetical protein JKK45_18575 [Shewanella algae]
MTGTPPKRFNIKVYEIDKAAPSPTESAPGNINSSDFSNFIDELTRKIHSSTSTKKYKFRSDSDIKLEIEEIAKNDLQVKYSREIAKELLQSEKNYDKRHPNTPIKQGSLIISKYNIQSSNYILIAKIDFESYFSKKNLTKNQGLPEEKGLLKAALFKIEGKKINSAIEVSDTNSRISRFWVDEFLKADDINTDQDNTKNSFKEFKRVINRVLKEHSDDKYTMLNSLITYFATKEKFDSSTFFNDLTGNYTFSCPKEIQKELSEEIEKKIKGGTFDGIFNLDNKLIKNNLKQSFKLDDDIVITTKKGNMERIFSHKIKGIKYVVIRTDNGFADFPSLKD